MDALQHFWASGWEAVLDSFDPAKGKFEHYVLFCLKRFAKTLWDKHQKERPNRRFFSGVDGDESSRTVELIAPGPCPETMLQQKNLLEKALAKLPHAYLVVFVRRELQGESTSEVARSLRRPEGTVRVRLHRARQMLIREIDRIGSPEEAEVAVQADESRATLRSNEVRGEPQPLLCKGPDYE